VGGEQRVGRVRQRDKGGAMTSGEFSPLGEEGRRIAVVGMGSGASDIIRKIAGKETGGG